MKTNRKPSEEQIEALGKLDTLDLEQAAKLMRLGQEATKDLIEKGELAALICNQKHVVLLRSVVLEYIAEEGRRQAEERRRRATGRQRQPVTSAATGKARGRARPPLPDLDRYELTTGDRPDSTPAGSHTA
jgi:hypothetical protein